MPIPITTDHAYNRGSWQGRNKRKKREGMLTAIGNCIKLTDIDGNRLWIDTPSAALLMKEVFLQLYSVRVIRTLGPEMTSELISIIDTLAEEYNPEYNPNWERQRMEQFIAGESVTDIRLKDHPELRNRNPDKTP